MTSVSLAQVFIRDIVCLFLGLPSLCARYNTDCARDTTQTAHEIKHRLRTRYNTVPKRLTFLKSYAPRERA